VGKSAYDSAIRADMSIGEGGLAELAPFYRESSKIVKRQYNLHKNALKSAGGDK
jgi:hypothetical protein